MLFAGGLLLQFGLTFLDWVGVGSETINFLTLEGRLETLGH